MPKKEISREEALKLDELSKLLQAKFRQAQRRNQEFENLREKEYKPITTAIQGLIEKEVGSDYSPVTSAIENLEKSVKTQLAPFQRALTYLPRTKFGDDNAGDDDFVNESDGSGKTVIFNSEAEGQSTPKKVEQPPQTVSDQPP